MVICDKLLRYFKQHYKLNFQDFINIPEKQGNHTLTIKIPAITNRRILLTIKYVYKYEGFYFDILPPEINDYIEQFLYETLFIEFNLIVNNEYPFEPPIWILSKLLIPENKYESFLHYYLYKLNIHKTRVTIDWSCILRFHKNILMFLSTINNYQELFECI